MDPCTSKYTDDLTPFQNDFHLFGNFNLSEASCNSTWKVPENGPTTVESRNDVRSLMTVSCAMMNDANTKDPICKFAIYCFPCAIFCHCV